MGLLKPAGKAEFGSLEVGEMRGDGGDGNFQRISMKLRLEGSMMEMAKDHGDKLAVDP